MSVSIRITVDSKTRARIIQMKYEVEIIDDDSNPLLLRPSWIPDRDETNMIEDG